MSEFLNRLIVSPLPDGKRWEVQQPFHYRYRSYDCTTTITVPSGFVTDFASVPRFFWRLLPPWGEYGPAAVLHDFLYADGSRPKKECDLIFKHAMIALMVPAWKRAVMYRAVAYFGGPAWRGHRRKDNA